MAQYDSHLTIGSEPAYGQTVTPNRSYAFTTADIDPVMQVSKATALRFGQSSSSVDDVAAAFLNGKFKVTFDVGSSGFGLWLKHCLGPVTLSEVNGKTAQTFKPGTLGSFTTQVNNPFNGSTPGGLPLTAGGCMVDNWNLKATVGKPLAFECDGVSKTVDKAPNMAAPFYAASSSLFNLSSGVELLLNGVPGCAESFTLTVNNHLDTDTRKLCQGGTMHEPSRKELLSVGIKLDKVAFENSVDYDRFRSTLTSERLVNVSVLITNPFASLSLALPACLPTAGGWNLAGTMQKEQTLDFDAFTSSDGLPPLTIVYTSSDTAP